MTKIDIISGFLGAGKTTLIKKLLAEARFTAGRIRQLLDEGFPVQGEDGQQRPVRPEDIVILMRSPAARRKAFTAALQREDIPCAGGEEQSFFETMEIAVMVSFLQIVDNPRQRRNLMLSILNENPGQYANLLSQARLNEDVEVVHYAATAMAQISAKEDIALQQRMEEYERNRDSDEALDRYREALEHYLESSMEQGYARTLQMRRYADLLAERLKRHNDYRTVCSLAKTQMDLGSFDAASRTIEAALSAWPRQGDVWLMKLRLEAARHDGEAVQRTVRHIKDDHIYLGGRGHDILRFWLGDKEAGRA